MANQQSCVSRISTGDAKVLMLPLRAYLTITQGNEKYKVDLVETEGMNL